MPMEGKRAHRINPVEMHPTGGSVVAGLVPATSPWYGIPPLQLVAGTRPATTLLPMELITKPW